MPRSEKEIREQLANLSDRLGDMSLEVAGIVGDLASRPVDPVPDVPVPDPSLPGPTEVVSFMRRIVRSDVETAKMAAMDWIEANSDWKSPQNTVINGDVHTPRVKSTKFSWTKDYIQKLINVPKGESTEQFIDNCVLDMNREEIPTGLKWFIRSYYAYAFTLHDTRVFGAVKEGRTWPIEHGAYVNFSGDVSIIDCLFKDLGGHGPYMAYRPHFHDQYTPGNAPFEYCPSVFIGQTALIDLDQDASRGAHAITLYDVGTQEYPGDIEINGVFSIHAWDFQRQSGDNTRFPVEGFELSKGMRSNSSMVATNYLPLEEGKPHPVSSILIADSLFWHVQSRRPLMNLRNAREYVFDGCVFKAEDCTQPYIDVGCYPDVDGREPDEVTLPPETVIIKNCESHGVQIRVWTTPSSWFILNPNEDHEYHA